MRTARIGLLVLATLALACGSSSSVPEPGAALLRLSCEIGEPLPDELRVWVYDDGGRLWDDARIPENGRLASTNAANLGTVLIAPGVINGALRIHIRALAGGERLADGMLSIPSLADAQRTYELRLAAPVPADNDGDGVPDAIDDCADLPNPGQGGCPAPLPADAGADSEPRPGDGPDTNSIAIADAQPGATDTRDAPADGPRAEVERDIPVVPADVGPDSVGDTKAQVPVDTSPGAGDGTDGKPPIDLGAARDASPVDLAGPVDVLAVDTVPVPVDSNPADASQADSCGTNCKKTQGELCAHNDECASSFCADGVCCTNSCAGPCRSCNQPTATGVCQGYTAGTDPEGECSNGARCNGAGACGAAPPPGRANGQACEVGGECLSGYCSDRVCCNEACNLPCQNCGTGACLPVQRADDSPECADTMTCNAKGRCVARGS